MRFDPAAPITAQVKNLGLFQMGPSTGVLLYKFHDADFALLYVGVTCTPTTRWQGHKNQAAWWSQVAWLEIERHPYNSAALDAERAAIRSELPRFNVRSFPGRSRNAPRIARESPGKRGRATRGREVAQSGLTRTRAPARRGALETGDRRQELVGHPCSNHRVGHRPAARGAWMDPSCP